ncbi:MAG TPA: YfiR family protein, partial [Verrucomicrobiae bacterium]
GVLTVADGDGFPRSGGMVGFVREGKKVALEINLRAAQREMLKISSKLLGLAKLYRGPDTALR